MKKELEVIKLQINAMETQISLIPEIKQFMETQKHFMDRKEDHTKTHAQILKIERKLFDAERINRETREKLIAAIESNGELKEAVTSWQNKAESAKGEVDRLTEATYLQGQQIKALKNKIENTHQAKRSQGQSHPTKQGDSSWNPKVSPGKKSNTQGPFTNVESTPSTPAPVTEHTESVSKNKVYRRGSENAEKMSSNSATPNKASSNPEVIQVRSPHILSMMEEREVFTYSLRQHKCAEVAYQIRQTEFILGPDSPILEKLAKMSGKAAKQHVRENVPYSAAWHKRRAQELRAIVTRLAEQDKLFRDALLATGDAEIRHNVPDTFWGTGTRTQHGLNMYGKILMELRDHLRGTSSTPAPRQHPEKESFAAVVNRDTQCIVITDSQGKWVDQDLIFGKRKTLKIKCSKAEDLFNLSQEMLNGPPKTQITTILINNGINNMRDRDNFNEVVDLQCKSIDALQEACPRAQIIYSLPLKRSRRYELNTLAQEISDFCSEREVDFISHSLHPRLFSDEFHLSEEGTKAFVARIHRHIYGPKWVSGEKRGA